MPSFRALVRCSLFRCHMSAAVNVSWAASYWSTSWANSLTQNAVVTLASIGRLILNGNQHSLIQFGPMTEPARLSGTYQSNPPGGSSTDSVQRL